MIIFRPISLSDLDSFLSICKQAPLGFYALPKTPQLVEHRLTRSLGSFKKEIDNPEKALYFFVAEDLETKTILGVSAINASTGGAEPLYFFKQEQVEISSPLSAVVKNITLLNPVSYPNGPSEVCALFVLPPYRHSGVGKLLSFARFLFIKSFPERFTSNIFAELRGPIDQNNSSPFWEGIGRHFFDMPITQVHEMLEYGRSFISQFLPKHPIYTNLLSKEVQESIGQVDLLAQGAFTMLRMLGFELTGEVDLFDAGPKLLASRENITVIKNSITATVVDIKEILPTETEESLLSNKELNFRSCYARISFVEPDTVLIEKQTAEALNVKVSDTLNVYL